MKSTYQYCYLIEWGRKRGNTEERVQTFQTVAELPAYSKKTGKIFCNTFDQEDSNVVPACSQL
jgi:hypothetical protein